MRIQHISISKLDSYNNRLDKQFASVSISTVHSRMLCCGVKYTYDTPLLSRHLRKQYRQKPSCDFDFNKNGVYREIWAVKCGILWESWVMGHGSWPNSPTCGRVESGEHLFLITFFLCKFRLFGMVCSSKKHSKRYNMTNMIQLSQASSTYVLFCPDFEKSSVLHIFAN